MECALWFMETPTRDRRRGRSNCICRFSIHKSHFVRYSCAGELTQFHLIYMLSEMIGHSGSYLNRLQNLSDDISIFALNT